jgi:hypothetical protein
MRRSLVAGSVIVLLVGLVVGHATLRSPPLVLSLSASNVIRGDPVRIRIEATGRPTLAGGPADIYLVSVFGPEIRYLTSSGVWSAEKAPLGTLASPGSFAPITVEWSAAPAAWIALGLLAVRSGGDPLDRASWAFPPVLGWVRVSEPRPATARGLAILAALAGLTLGGIAAVAAFPRTTSSGRERTSPKRDRASGERDG